MSALQLDILRQGASPLPPLADYEQAQPTGGRMRLAVERRKPFFESFPCPSSAVEAVALRAGPAPEAPLVGLAVLNRLAVCGSGGRKEQLAFVSSLRIAPAHRSSAAFLAGLRALHAVLLERTADLLLGFVLEDAAEARKLLLGRKRRVLQTADIGRYHSCIIRCRPKRIQPSCGADIQPAQPDDLPALCKLLSREAEKRAYYPLVRQSDLLEGNTFRGLSLADFLVAKCSGELCGAIGIWNQQRYRRWLVHSYTPLLRLLRPLYNAGTMLAGGLSLPATGMPLPQYFGAFCAVEGDDPELFLALLAAAENRLCCRRKRPLLALGMHEKHPLAEAALRQADRRIASRMLLLSFDGPPQSAAFSAGRTPHFELGLM